MDAKDGFTTLFVQHWDDFIACCRHKDGLPVKISGRELTLAKVAAISRYGVPVEIAAEPLNRINLSVRVVKDSLAQGLVIYGVNTGFGGSADTRSSAVGAIQNMLIRMLNFGIISGTTRSNSHSQGQDNDQVIQGRQSALLASALPLEDPLSSTSMPESWSRASMVVRLNSLVSGASGVKAHTIKVLASLLNKNIVPLIPLRGSISASGDLSPLSYIAGAMQGRPTIKVWTGDVNETGDRLLVRADRALAEAGVKAVTLGPKEGLAIVNGTSVSAGVAALALHEAHCQAALSQILTAMSVEALQGTDESFDPFIAQVRPHPGQIDSAKNIFAFLSNSKLVNHHDGQEEMTLRQDRYSIRTASQWVGPVLEDLVLAHKQISVELNSVTDNPLINTITGGILHGGNFQAKAVSSAMEKTRAGIQAIGKMLFTQCTELINPATNRGLPPNLVIDDPSTSAIWKGTDIMVAALTSELGFLASPIAPHVQHAEMGNQALNSLALISARYTLTAVDVLTQLSAAHLLALCQALDLRAFQHTFLDTFKPHFMYHVAEACTDIASNSKATQYTESTTANGEFLWMIFKKQLALTTSLDAEPRIKSAIESLQPHLLRDWPESAAAVSALKHFTKTCAAHGIEQYEAVRKTYRNNPDATALLGSAGKRMYTYVRATLGVPFFGNDELDDDDASMEVAVTDGDLPGGTRPGREPASVGAYITRVYEAMKSGDLYNEVVECFKEVEEARACD